MTEQSNMIVPLLADKIFGSLIGLCFADAVGACFEGMSREELHAKFKAYAAACQPTDDQPASCGMLLNWTP